MARGLYSIAKTAPNLSVISALDIPNLQTSLSQRIAINVSGMIFETRLQTLERFPETLLGNRIRRQQFYDKSTNEYFFERDRSSFEAILSFYRSGGQLTRPANVSFVTFLEEIQFFDLGTAALHQLFKQEHLFGHRHRKQPSGNIQRRLWLVVEHPSSSRLAFFYNIWNVFVVLVSVTALCVQTLPSTHTNVTVNVSGEYVHLRADEAGWSHVPEARIFFAVETLCIIWFCLDLLFRFLLSPEKLTFFLQLRNGFDLFIVSPYFLNLLLYTIASRGLISAAVAHILFRAVRVIRVLRLLKIAGQIRGMQVLVYTIRASTGELLLLALLVTVFVVIFATAIYYAESDLPGSPFRHIPGSFYWAIITMTTVGYGDEVAFSSFGQVVSCLCGLTGMLVFALCVPAVARTFEEVRERMQKEKEIERILNRENEVVDANAQDKKAGSRTRLSGRTKRELTEPLLSGEHHIPAPRHHHLTDRKASKSSKSYRKF
ncbi:potassium voltage-gated channel subfamily A member 10-like [Paramacrobiotus metropolitanus]|uniref:potassium voltage-gated channel subfamily A member 10-like n=1 Tax=Paramacrobiotus metropolitanus TaxID=2943436 RepID=UPI00244639B3|nr:potassium voltage-gated channel subfamily A member 10-like [Paramacrobiotus metropolitanus]